MLRGLTWKIKQWQVISRDLETSNNTPDIVIDILEYFELNYI